MSMQGNQLTTAPWQKRKANPDLAAQVDILRAAIIRHAKTLDALLINSGNSSEPSDHPGHCRLFKSASLEERWKSARKGDERIVAAELELARKLGEMRRLAASPSHAKLCKLAADFPHFEPVIELMRQRAALARVTPGQVFSMPPLLLSGPPGVGKTAFASALARLMHLPFKRMDIGSSTAGFALAGSHSSWSSAKPGAVWQLLQSPSAAGVMLLDEIDKAADSKYPVLGPLYTLLERVSATHFSDEFMDIEIDASHIMWLATCNDADLLEPALRSRFIELEIPKPSADQMLPIARSVYRELQCTAAWGKAFASELPEDVAKELTTTTPRELVKVLEDAVARAAAAGRLRLMPSDILLMSTAKRHTQPKLGFI